mgnify:CR=1 FL=1
MRLLGALSKGFRTVFDVPISGSDVSDISGTYSPTVVGGVTVSGGIASFHNSSSERIYYSPVGSGKLRLQTDTEFVLKFTINPKGDLHVLASCLNATKDNGFYIFVNDSISTLGFYGVGVGGILLAAVIPIGVPVVVRCIIKLSTNQLIIYVNDVLAATETYGSITGITNEPRDVCLGVFSDSNTIQPLYGDIDYILIKDKTG